MLAIRTVTIAMAVMAVATAVMAVATTVMAVATTVMAVATAVMAVATTVMAEQCRASGAIDYSTQMLLNSLFSLMLNRNFVSLCGPLPSLRLGKK